MKEWKIRLLHLGMTQKEFCKYAGIYYTLFSRYVNNHANPSTEMIKRIDEKLKELENKK